MLSGQPARGIRFAGQQRSQTGVHALDVGTAQRAGENPVQLPEQVVDVGGAGRRVRPVQVPVGVGGPDDPVRPPGDHEQHARLGPQDQAGLTRQPVPPDHEVHTLGCPYPQAHRAAEHPPDVIAPYAGGRDHRPGPDVDLRAGLQAADLDPGHRGSRSEQAHDAGTAQYGTAVRRRRPCQSQRVPGVVDLRVVEPDRPAEAIRAQGGEGTQRRAARQMAVTRYAAGGPERRGEQIVEQDTGTEVGALPDRGGQRQQERQWTDQMRCDGAQLPATLDQRLAHQREVELFQVAQAAVHELARTARRPGRPVPGLEQRHGQAAAGRVESRPRSGDPAAHDDDVEDLAAESTQVPLASLRPQPVAVIHRRGWTRVLNACGCRARGR